MLKRAVVVVALVALAGISVLVFGNGGANPQPGAAATALQPLPAAARPSPTTQPVQPAPTAAATPAPSVTAATATATATPPPAAKTYVIANTGGQGANLRREPLSGERIRTWMDGTVLTGTGGERNVGGEVWRQVKDPAGNTGWIIDKVLAPGPTPRATATPASAGTPSPTVSSTPTAIPSPTATSAPTPPSAKLELQAANGYAQGGQLVVEGKVKNISGESVWDVWAVADWYDEAGQIAKTYFSPLAQDPLRADQVSSFKVAATAKSGVKYFVVRFADGKGNDIPSNAVTP